MDQSRCVVCGTRRTRSFKRSVKTNGLNYEENVILQWKSQCSKSLCEVLFNSYEGSTTSFFEYFQNGNYCTTCQQTVRDFNFSWKQLESFQAQVDRFSKDICQLIDRNYKCIKSKTSKTIIKQNISKLTDEDSLPHYSSSEIIEMINFVTSKKGLMPLPVPLEKQCPVKTEMQSMDFEIKSENIDDGEYSQNQPESEDEYAVTEALNCPNSESENGSDTEEQFDHLDDPLENKTYSDSNQSSISSIPKRRAKKRKLHRSFQETNKTPQENKIHGLSLEDKEIEYIKHMTQTGKLKYSRPTAVGLAVYLKLHICTWESIDELILSEDEKEYARKMKSKSHRKIKHLNKFVDGKGVALTCSIENCNKIFTVDEKLEAHMREHDGETHSFYCTSCPVKCKDYHQMLKHRKRIHNGVKLSLYYFCKICAKGYATETELSEHSTTSHQGPNPFQCAFCEVQFSSSNLLIDHTRKNHSEAPYLSNTKPEYCRDCGRRFSNKDALQKHLSMPDGHANGSNLFKCTVCSSKFNSKTELNNHKKVHTSVCEICGKEVTSTWSLKKHLDSVHGDVRRYKCSVCDRQFKTHSQLLDHERVHSGIRSFLCKVCGKGFMTTNILRGHELIHQPGYIPRKPFRRKKQRPWKSSQQDHSNDPVSNVFAIFNE